MTSPDAQHPAFFCPACGQKHRADLSTLEGQPEAVLKAACVRCKKPLAVSLSLAGEVRCVIPGAETPAPGAAAPTPTPKPTAPVPAWKREREAAAAAGKPTAPVPAAKREAAAPAEKPTAPVPAAKREAAAAAEKPTAPVPAAKREAAAPAEKPTAPVPTAKREAAAPAEKPTAPVPTAKREAAAPAPKAKAETPVSARATAREKQREEERAAQGQREVTDAEFPVDAVVGRYRIEEAIGQGGTGTVYRAFDPTTNRSVALKVLLREMSETMRQRFQREIEVQANIRHPNIMPVFDRGTLPDGRPYFTMELLYKPFTLTEIVELRERGTLGRYATMAHLGEMERLIKDLLVPVAEGLYVANVENGVIHRDLKPDNVLLDSRTLRPYLIDFGICSVLDRSGKLSGDVVVSPVAEDAGIVGTPRFLAPEQARGTVGPRTDVWGLGALIHFAITGEPPIAAATGITRSELKERVEALKRARDDALAADNDRRVALADEKLARLQDAGLRTMDDIFRDAREARYRPLPAYTPAPLAALVRKAMAAEPGDRYVNVRQIASELTTWVEGGRVRALTEAGGTGAAVDSAKRALRRNWASLLLGAGGLVAGFLIGGGAGTILRTSDTDVIRSLGQAIGDFKRGIDVARLETASAVGPEAARLHRLLWQQAEALAQRIAAEPRGSARESLEEQLAFQRRRIQRQRVRLVAPAGYTWSADRTGPLGLERLELKPGDDNLLYPGDWSVVGTVREAGGAEASERVRLPLRLPFVVREEGVVAEREPPAATLEVPLAPGQIPTGMLLVVGASIPVRRPPFAEPSLAPTQVRTFLIDRTEVTNSEYAGFLLTLPDAEAQERAPKTGFVRDPGSGRMTAIRGVERLPVVAIRPQDARAYAAWRAKRDGAKVRLPSEAEWLVAAGAPAGYVLPGGRDGTLDDAVFHPALAEVGSHAMDVGPHGERDLLGNAREMVEPVEAGVPEKCALVKGAGLGDTPNEASIYLVRPLLEGERHATTGFRLVREL